MYIEHKIINKDHCNQVIDLIIKDAKRKRKHYPRQIPLDYHEFISLSKLSNIVKTHIDDVLREDLYLSNRDIPEIYYIALNRPTGRIFDIYGLVYTTKDFLMTFNKVTGKLTFHIPKKSEVSIPLYQKLKDYQHKSPH